MQRELPKAASARLPNLGLNLPNPFRGAISDLARQRSCRSTRDGASVAQALRT